MIFSDNIQFSNGTVRVEWNEKAHQFILKAYLPNGHTKEDTNYSVCKINQTLDSNFFCFHFQRYGTFRENEKMVKMMSTNNRRNFKSARQLRIHS